jgi:4-amino-4-deoxy-L-arabinose transferase-like glycosyltransferase
MIESRIRWPLALLLVAVVARIVAALAVGGDFHFADEAIYLDAARRLAGGDGFATAYRRVPAYPVFLALLSFGVPVGLVFIRLAQAAVAGFGTLLVMALAERMIGRRAAIAAGLVYALDPLLVMAAGLLYPETVAALVLPLVILLALGGAERDSPGRSALAGGVLGVLALLRPVALVLPPVVAAWIALAAPARGTRRLVHVGALGLAFLLVLAPWTVRNWRVYGQLVPVAMAGTHTAPLQPADVARRGLLLPLARWVWTDPLTVLSRGGRQFLQFWELAPSRLTTDDPLRREQLNRRDPRLSVQPLFSRGLRDRVSAGSFGLELALALLGLVVVARRRWRQALLPLAVIVAFAAGYALFVAKLRYRMPVLPLVFVFTGAGVAAVHSFALGRLRPRGPASGIESPLRGGTSDP